MNYIDTLKNKELVGYFKILSLEYPLFIDKYINTLPMKRLDALGQFCGCDYTNIIKPKFWYTRLHHSIACALITWNFTKSKVQTLAALFHDLGTPAFSHCVDFLLNDSINQESSEKNIFYIINRSTEIKNLLNNDNISLSDVTNLEKHTIVENKKPKICVDRLEGVFSTCLIWRSFWNLDDIKKIYAKIDVLKNDENELELGFRNKTSAENFFDGVYKYSIILQSNEDKFIMQFIADTLKILLDNKKLKFNDLYDISEEDVIKIIKNEEILRIKWEKFNLLTHIIKTNDKLNEKYFKLVDCKKRYVIPLVKIHNETKRLNIVSKKCQDKLDYYMNYHDSLYVYNDF